MNGDHLHAMRDLADWQIMDRDNRMIGKVDDLVFAVAPDALPLLISVLTGGTALAARFGGAWTDSFRWLAQRVTTAEPLDIPLTLLERKSSNLTTTVDRDVLEHYRSGGDQSDTLRLSALIGCQLIAAGAEPCGRVADLWLTSHGEALHGVRAEGLIVGPGAIGDRLGFDHRHGPDNPPGLRWLFRRLGRSTRFLPWDAVTAIEPRCVRTTLNAGEITTLAHYEQA